MIISKVLGSVVLVAAMLIMIETMPLWVPILSGSAFAGGFWYATHKDD